jgi:hypothetical protein
MDNTCTVQMRCGHYSNCGRPAVKELTNRGAHVMWLCKLHS